jgi:cytochrome c oxidase assembly protein subunit 15
MAGGVLFEHSHRMVAGAVALMVGVLCLWMRISERRPWVRRLAYAAGALVVAQALLGGLTVLMQLPPAVSAAHAGLAVVVFAVVTALAVVTSAAWARSPAGVSAGAARLGPWASAAAALIYAQVLIGAIVRHLGAGLACPDFPLCHGRLVPPLTSFFVGIHFLHRVGAVLVVLAVLGLSWAARRWSPDQPGLQRLANGLAALVFLQFALGAASILTRLAAPVTVAHQAGGAAVFAGTVLLAVWAHRVGRRAAREPVPQSPLAPEGAR